MKLKDAYLGEDYIGKPTGWDSTDGYKTFYLRLPLGLVLMASFQLSGS